MEIDLTTLNYSQICAMLYFNGQPALLCYVRQRNPEAFQ